MDRKPLAIHNSKGFFTERWIAYCEREHIPYRLVNCHRSDVIDQVRGCAAVLYNHHQGNPVDLLMAKPLLFALEHAGIPVFPDFKTNWHFDDKVGQKYLFEALDVKERIPTWIFYSESEALAWTESVPFPKVFKLSSGAGSQHVRLVRNAGHAKALIRQAFGRGFPRYAGWDNLRERYRKFRLGKSSALDVLKGLVRLVWAPRYARLLGRVRGYVYFQEFLPGNPFDIRVIVIGDRAFALKRLVREGDFRASGSGSFKVGREEFREDTIQLAFDLNQRLNAQCVAYDFVFDQKNKPRVVEINYGFWPGGYDNCPGYWDRNLNWHEGLFDPYGWMVEMQLKTDL